MLLCEISGEPLIPDFGGSSGGDDIVVTPSGHVCWKRLLLAKLSENGGMDPFAEERPLSEDELVVLHKPKNSSVPPPSSKGSTSFSSMLSQLGKEYDAVMLELFDTRKALQDTRRELSQALYQNDAAIRVVARLATERDAARQELQRFQLSGAVPVQNGSKAQNETADDNEEQPSSKKPRLSLPLEKDIPPNDLQLMLTKWEDLHQSRKQKSKAAKGYVLPKDWTVSQEESWHLSTCRSITAMDSVGQYVVTAGADKQIMVYDSTAKQVHRQWSTGKLVASSLACTMVEERVFVLVACLNELRVYDSANDSEASQEVDLEDTIVHVAIHPTGKHVVATTQKGVITILNGFTGDDLQSISVFKQEEPILDYTCGALHPDGLIYAAATGQGQVLMWDFKNKVLASTLKTDSETTPVVDICFSNNGYHLATAHKSGAVYVWDLRKQKTVAELHKDRKLQTITALAFHEGGKFLAYGGDAGIQFTTVKEWGVTAELSSPGNFIAWGSQWIAAAAAEGRKVTLLAPQGAKDDNAMKES